MTIDPRKAQVARIVCDQFILMCKGTTRHSLVRIIKDGALLDQMANQSLLREEENRCVYFPTLGTFALLPDDDSKFLAAKLGSLQILHTLQNLYEVEGPNVLYTGAQIVDAVHKGYDKVNDDEVMLGLYLVDFPRFGAVQSYGRTDDHLGMKSLMIAERIMIIDDPEATWVESVESCRQSVQMPNSLPKASSGATDRPVSHSIKPTARQKSWLPNGWTGGKLLGEGGQGRTYKVRRTSDEDGDWFVFKRIKNIDRVERLISEIHALRTLTHPGILRIVESDILDGTPYYIAEYCSNGDLSKRNFEATTLLEKLILFRQICSAVASAHAAKIVHRDLKPSNILVRGDGTIAIGDFGLCLDLEALDRVTETKEAVGPRNFMAPELEDGRRLDVTPAADVYSLGKLLYYLLSGGSVFSREKHRELAHDLTRPPSGSPEGGIHFAYELLDKSIVQESDRRLQNAAELIAAVDSVIRRVVMNAHVLDLNTKQPCLYCVDGEYRVLGQIDQYRFSLCCFRCGNVQQFSPPHNGWKNWWMR